jgi:hypothetical chaperone protein
MRVGIDFGTTNSGIAIYDGAGMHLFKVDELLPDLLPSIIYITKQFAEYVGSEARDLYLQQNVNRPSRFEKIWVGELEMWVSTATSPKLVRMDVFAWNDVLAPGRLLKSVKTALRSQDYEGTHIFSQKYMLEQLIAILLRHLVSTVETRLGQPITSAVLGRPVKFSDDTAVDQRAETIISAAAELAGLADVRFLPEPIAAAYTFHKQLGRRQTVLVFDFGGGTLDLTVARLGGTAEPEILATEGVLIGGDDFDRRLFEHLLPHFGHTTTSLVNGQPIPAYIWDVVLHWEASEGQQMANVIEFVREAVQSGSSSNPTALHALEQLLTQNLQYKLLQEIVRAKIALSAQTATTIRFNEGGIALQETIDRSQFEALIQPEVSEIALALDRVVARSGHGHDQIGLIINTGGSSQIPVFSDLLADRFPAATISSETGTVLTGVVQGLAIWGHDLDQKENDAVVPTKRQLVRRLVKGEQIEGVGTAVTPAATHFIVGLTAGGELTARPWSANDNQPAAGDQSPLVQGLLCGRQAPLLLGTLWSKFLPTTAQQLFNPTQEQVILPRHLQPDEMIGDRYVLLAKWAELRRGELRRAELLLLVTQTGQVRAFPLDYVENQIETYNQWRLEQGGKPDIPATVLAVAKADEVVLLAENGRVIRLNVADISVRGQRALRLKQPLPVHALRLNGAEQVVALGRSGQAAVCPVADIPVAGRLGGTGKQLLRNEPACALLSLTNRDTAAGLTAAGRIVELNLADLTANSQAKVVELNDGEELVSGW